jgi:hypothetical protein
MIHCSRPFAAKKSAAGFIGYYSTKPRRALPQSPPEKAPVSPETLYTESFSFSYTGESVGKTSEEKESMLPKSAQLCYTKNNIVLGGIES